MTTEERLAASEKSRKELIRLHSGCMAENGDLRFRLAELERLAREVVDRVNRGKDHYPATERLAAFLTPTTPTPEDIDAAMVCGNDLSQRVQRQGKVLATRKIEVTGTKPWVDPTASWPLCATCGKSAREGRHCTDLGEGHEYVPKEPKERTWRIERLWFDHAEQEHHWGPSHLDDIPALDAEGALLAYGVSAPEYRAVEVKEGT